MSVTSGHESDRGAPPTRTLYFVTGILVNLRLLIPDAVETGKRYGYDVRILDLNQLVPAWAPYPNPWASLGLADRVDRPESNDALDQFCARRSGKDDQYVFLHLPENEVLDIWRRLQRTGAEVGVMTVSPVPIRLPGPEGLLARVESGVRRMLRPLKARLKPRPDLWIVSGEASVPSYQSFFRDLRQTRFIAAHSLDYEYSRAFINQHFDDQHVLFLDQGWFSKLRPDFLANDRYPPTSKANYQSAIVDFLRGIELAGLGPVTVSAHPKANLQDTKALYSGLHVSSEPTVELARHASLVIGNCTTSLQFAVIFRKPILLFTSDELDQSIMYPGLAGFRDALGAPVVNIDQPQNFSSFEESVSVDHVRYQQFVIDYIDASGGENRPLFDKIFSQLSSSAVH